MTDDEVWLLRWRATGMVHNVYATEHRAWREAQVLVQADKAHSVEAFNVEPWTVIR